MLEPVDFHIHLEIRCQHRDQSVINSLNFTQSNYHDILELIRTFNKGLVNAVVFLSLDELRITCSICWFLGPIPALWARLSKDGAWDCAFIKSFPGDFMLSKDKSWPFSESSLPVFVFMSLLLWPHTSIFKELLLSHLCFESPLFHIGSL